MKSLKLNTGHLANFTHTLHSTTTLLEGANNITTIISMDIKTTHFPSQIVLLRD